MVPFPRLHFFTAGYAPLVSSGSRAYTASNVSELTAAAFQRRSLLAAIDPMMGKYLTVSVAYRGKLAMRDIENAVYEYQSKNSAHFVPWIPNGALTTLCSVPPIGQTASATLVANTTAIAEVFKRSHNQFRQLYSRKAYLHWYTGEGMYVFRRTWRALLTLLGTNLSSLVSGRDVERYGGSWTEPNFRTPHY